MIKNLDEIWTEGTFKGNSLNKSLGFFSEVILPGFNRIPGKLNREL